MEKTESGNESLSWDKYIFSTIPDHFSRRTLGFHYHNNIPEVVRKALFWLVVSEGSVNGNFSSLF